MGGSIAPEVRARNAVTCADAAVDRSIGDRFDEVAAANSQRMAILTTRGAIRYGALASLSDRIAAHSAHFPRTVAVAPSPSGPPPLAPRRMPAPGTED